jgi:hypothetical protein
MLARDAAIIRKCFCIKEFARFIVSSTIRYCGRFKVRHQQAWYRFNIIESIVQVNAGNHGIIICLAGQSPLFIHAR